MLSRFPSVTEHVSSKLPSPVNCLNSPIYTSQYLARVLLPCQFSLHSSILPVNYFLALPNHPTSLIHFGFYCWTPFSFSKRFLRLNTLLYSTLVSCRLHCTQYDFINAHVHTVPLETMHYFSCRFVLEGGSRDFCTTTMRWRWISPWICDLLPFLCWPIWTFSPVPPHGPGF